MRRTGTLTFAVVAVALTALAASHGTRRGAPQTSAAVSAAVPAASADRPMRLLGPIARR